MPMKQSFKKDICPKCHRVRIILPCKLFSSIPAWRCTKCGYAWKKMKGESGL